MTHLPTLPDTASILHELALIVGPNANDAEPDILDLFVRSKHIMRQVNNVVKAHKEATVHARAEMDAVLLVLQNLLYEKRHVEREITRCQEFGSIYQDIPLHSVDEFLELAPPGMCPPEIMTNDHQLMIQRLSFELAERQRLLERKNALVVRKEELLNISAQRQGKEESWDKQTEELAKALVGLRRSHAATSLADKAT